MILALLLALAPVPAAPADNLGPGWVNFSRRPALRRGDVEVSMGTLDVHAGHYRYWLRRVAEGAGVTRVDWTDSDSCPAVARVLERMRALPMPGLTTPDRDSGNIILDGIGYRLKVGGVEAGQSVDVELRSNVETSLARWVESSLKELAPCWSATVPVRQD